MNDYLIVLGLVGEVLILVRLDRRLYGTWLTPVALLGIPYTCVVVLAWIVAPILDFVPLYMESVLYWMAGLFLFWAAGTIVGVKTWSLFRSSAHEQDRLRWEQSSEAPGLFLAWLAIAVLLIGFMASLRTVGGFGEFGTEAFEHAYGYGFTGHVLTFLLALLIFLIGIIRPARRLIGVTILIGFLFAIAYQVKSWIYIPLLAGVLYRAYRGRLRLSIWKTLQMAVLMVALFFGVYLAGFGARNPAVLLDFSMYKFLARHLTSYLFSGVLAFGETVREGFPFIQHDPVSRIFSGLVNLWRMITSRELVSFVDPNLVNIDANGVYTSNVHTLFGALFAYLGWKGALVYTMCMGLAVYGLFAVARRSNNCWVLVIWCYIASNLLFGWHELNFWHLAVVIELPAYCLLMAMLTRLFKPGRLPFSDQGACPWY